MMVAALVLLAVFGLSPVGDALVLPLEQRFPEWNAKDAAPDGIVVLGGAIGIATSTGRGQPTLNEAAERMTATVELARRFPQARIVFSSGIGVLFGGEISEAAIAAAMFEKLGIPPGHLTLEDQSRNTFENAVFSRRVADPKPGERWLLVTSASHMPRAIGAFRRAGFTVEPYPVDWRTAGPADLTTPFPRVSEGLRRCDMAMREWVGLLVYWLVGHTSELFPGPEHP